MVSNPWTNYDPYDPNRPIDASGPDQVFYVNPSATRSVTDGVTNSTTVVTSATANFTVEDIGKSIIGTGIPYLAMIESLNSSTSVNISLPATASASGVTLTIGGHYPSQKFEDTTGANGQGFILPPVQANTSTATTGGTLAAATYYYVITAVGVGGAGAGETTKSNEKSQVTTGTTSTVTLTWSASAGAGGYKIYRSTSTGTEVYLTTVSAGVTSFIDTGSITPGTATPPTTNTALTFNPTFQYASTVNTHEFNAGYNLGVEGVVVNDIVVTDGVTNSTTTITSATAGFTSGMIGAGVVGAGIPAGAYIKSVPNSTTAILSVAATASASGVTLTIGLPYLDGSGYGYLYATNKPNAPYDGTTDGASSDYTIVPGDTTQTAGHTASFGSSPTYGQSLVDGSVDQQFGAESNFPGTAGPGASGGVFTNQGSGTVGASTANPITGNPDTLGWKGGASTAPTGVPIPNSYAVNAGDPLGDNASGALTTARSYYGAPLFISDGFDTPGHSGNRTTTNELFNHTYITDNNGAVTSTPVGYALSTLDTLYGYPGLTPASSGGIPGAPTGVSWTFGAGSATVSWTPPASNGGNNIREYVVRGYQIRDDSYRPNTAAAFANFVAEPAVSWKGTGGTFLNPPVQNAIVGSTSGGTLAAGTYYYVVTALGTTGETVASNEQSVTNTGTTSSNAISWAAVTGAASYNVYRGTATGAEVLLKNVSGTTYSDTNADTPGTATPPTASSAVTPTTSARVEHLTPGFYYFFMVYARNDVGSGPVNDPAGSAPPSSPNNTPKYFMGYGMSGAVNTELDENALLTAEFAADRL